MHLPPEVPVLHLLGLLGPLGLANLTGQELEEGVGEALHNLVNTSCLQQSLVLFCHLAEFVQLDNSVQKYHLTLQSVFSTISLLSM